MNTGYTNFYLIGHSNQELLKQELLKQMSKPINLELGGTIIIESAPDGIPEWCTYKIIGKDHIINIAGNEVFIYNMVEVKGTRERKEKFLFGNIN